MATYVGRLTYWARGFSPSSFLCIGEDKEALEKWAIAKWNEMMPHALIPMNGVEELRTVHKRNSSWQWDVWEREEGEIQMHHIIE